MKRSARSSAKAPVRAKSKPAPKAPSPADTAEQTPDPSEDLAGSRRKIDAKLLENILDKIAAGGVPTEREMRILNSATADRQQGRPSKTIRWTVEHAATEFGPDRRTLAKRLRDASIEPGADNRYSTRDICRAIFQEDDPRKEKDRAQAENFRIKNEELQRTRIPIHIVSEIWDAALQSFAATLKAAKGKQLDAPKINELIAILRSAKLPLKW